MRARHAAALNDPRLASRSGSRKSPPVAAVNPGKKNHLPNPFNSPLITGDGRPCERSTYGSALRYSRLIHTGGVTPVARWAARASCASSGGWQPKVSTQTWAGASASQKPAGSGVVHGITSIQGCVPSSAPGAIQRSGSGWSIQSRMCCPLAARLVARRQHTPMSPRLSTTWQNTSHVGRPWLASVTLEG